MPSRRWTATGLFTLIMALFLYENIILIQAELRFTADCQRDLFLVYGLSHEGVFPHTGIRVAALGLDSRPALPPITISIHRFLAQP